MGTLRCDLEPVSETPDHSRAATHPPNDRGYTLAVTRVSVSVLVIAVTTFLPAAALAQDRPAEFHASGLLVAQPGTTPFPRISPPLSGQTLAGAIGLSRSVTGRTAIEAEIVFGGTVSNRQRFEYSGSVDYVAESRDTLLNLLARWHPTRSRAFAIVAGGAWPGPPSGHARVSGPMRSFPAGRRYVRPTSRSVRGIPRSPAVSTCLCR